MDKILLIIGPFAAAMALRRIGILRERHAGLLTDYIIYFSLPCLTITTISSLDLRSTHFEVAIVAWAVMSAGVILSYSMGKMLGMAGARLRTFVLVATFPNTGFLGYPLSYAVFGGPGLTYAVIYDQMGMFPVFLTLGFFVAGGKESFGGSLKFPPFVALLFAVLLNITGVPIPHVLFVLLKGAGWTTLPLTIFLIGAKITLKISHNAKHAAACLALRMLVIPAMLYVFMVVFEKQGLAYEVALMESAMPPALTTSILAAKYGLDEDLAITSISIGTLFCMLAFAVFAGIR